METYKKITLLVRDEDDNLEKILDDIKKSGNIGHTFDIVIDPDEKGGRKYGWDGDGADHIHYIKVETMKSDKPPKFTNEGLYKPGGKYIGIISKQPKRMVKCPKCKGTGDMSDTKSGITCDKCKGSGKLYVDVGERQRDDVNENQEIKPGITFDYQHNQWEIIDINNNNVTIKNKKGERYNLDIRVVKRAIKYHQNKSNFPEITSVKYSDDIEEMSTIAGVAGFNAPMSKQKNKKLKEDSQFKQKFNFIVTVTDSNATMVTKRNEPIMKKINVLASSSDKAKDLAINFYKKQGYRIKNVELTEMKSFKQIIQEAKVTWAPPAVPFRDLQHAKLVIDQKSEIFDVYDSRTGEVYYLNLPDRATAEDFVKKLEDWIKSKTGKIQYKKKEI